MSAETPKAIVPFTEEWFAYIISTRTEEGSIRCLSMMTQAELQRLRGLLEEAREVLEEINEEPMAKMPQELWKQLRSVLSNLKK